MKSIYKILLLSITISSFGQNTPAGSLVDICSGLMAKDVPDKTYFSDTNNSFGKFIGTWQWTNGNEIVIFVLTKVTHRYFPDEKIYQDYMIGNYSYSTDGGKSYVVNTITNPINENPDVNPMYTGCGENNKLKFIFRDVILDKSYCYATFQFSPSSLTQMKVFIENPKEIPGSFIGQTTYNYNFTLPIDMVVTKQ